MQCNTWYMLTLVTFMLYDHLCFAVIYINISTGSLEFVRLYRDAANVSKDFLGEKSCEIALLPVLTSSTHVPAQQRGWSISWTRTNVDEVMSQLARDT